MGTGIGDPGFPSGLRRLVASREGHFLLESGHHGNRWLDLERLFLRPRLLAPWTTALAYALAHYDVEAICGPLTGGAFVAQMVATELDLEFCYTERVGPVFAGGSCPVGYRLPPGLHATITGRRVAVTDDAINAGSAVGGTIAALGAAGAVPAAVATLLDLDGARADPATFDGLPLVSLLAWPAERWSPEAYPLCAAGVPVEDATAN